MGAPRRIAGRRSAQAKPALKQYPTGLQNIDGCGEQSLVCEPEDASSLFSQPGVEGANVLVVLRVEFTLRDVFLVVFQFFTKRV